MGGQDQGGGEREGHNRYGPEGGNQEGPLVEQQARLPRINCQDAVWDQSMMKKFTSTDSHTLRS